MAMRDNSNRPVAKSINAPTGVNQKPCEMPDHLAILMATNVKTLAMKTKIRRPPCSVMSHTHERNIALSAARALAAVLGMLKLQVPADF